MSVRNDGVAYLQARLNQYGAGLLVDGLWGGRTQLALDAALPAKAAQSVARTLKNPAAFFQGAKAVTGTLTQSQVDGINYLLKAMERWPVQWVAYGLATSYWETAKTFQPIEEIGKGRGRKYGVPGPHGGQIAYGRGHVQLTWPDNYQKADDELGLGGALVKDYRKALDPKIAADILVRGMEEGWFTGKSLKSYEPGDYVNDRRIINGTDKAHQIAGYARQFETALTAGVWS